MGNNASRNETRNARISSSSIRKHLAKNSSGAAVDCESTTREDDHKQTTSLYQVNSADFTAAGRGPVEEQLYSFQQQQQQQRSRQQSNWSLGSLSGRLNWSFTGATKGTFRHRNKTSIRKSFSSLQQKRSKTTWHRPLTNAIFSSHFKETSRNEHFHIDSLIAKGAFGVVFKVIDKQHHQQQLESSRLHSINDNAYNNSEHFVYALKVLKKSKIIEDNSVQQIKDEADIQKLCGHHPFIVRQFDLWQNRRNLHILSEYVPNGELFSKIVAFSIDLIRLYVAEIALAIDFLHNAGIIYRDAKPENILLNETYHIKLTDFGLSKWLKLGSTTKTMCGTFQYMAPEILRGGPYGHAVDWWSLGIITCQMFTDRVFKYKSPIVSVREGDGWIVNGCFKFIHVVDLDSYRGLLTNISSIANSSIHNGDKRLVFEYHLNWIANRLDEMRARSSRRIRSINWLGSAWKWIAGSPDADDWNSILQSESNIIENNNHQYKVNEKLFATTREALQRVNQVVNKINSISKDNREDQIEGDILNKLLVIRAEVSEIVRACQMAKTGIVNGNMLDKEEINQILAEVETLPYQNVIEAIEFGRPSVYTNGSLLLYVLAMPKLSPAKYHLLITRATIFDGRQVDLKFSQVLVSQTETYGLKGKCLVISNSTVCEEKALEKVPEDNCLPRILKGGHAKCQFRTNKEEVVEMLTGSTIFLTNFRGEVLKGNTTTFLEGTNLIQLTNETIFIGNQTFTSKTISHFQALPPVLANVTNQGHKVDIDYLHELSIENIKRLGRLKSTLGLYLISDLVIIILVILTFVAIWHIMTRKLKIPPIKTLEEQPNVAGLPQKSPRSYHSHFDLRDADL